MVNNYDMIIHLVHCLNHTPRLYHTCLHSPFTPPQSRRSCPCISQSYCTCKLIGYCQCVHGVRFLESTCVKLGSVVRDDVVYYCCSMEDGF